MFLHAEDARDLCESLKLKNGTPPFSDIDKMIIPILAELLSLEPGNNRHLAVKHLSDWLLEPHRTGEEFRYVVGPLQRHVFSIMFAHFKDYMYQVGNGSLLGKIAANALAIKCPVMEGPWEHIGWFLVEVNSDYSMEKHGAASNHFSAWIIQVISDSDLCPNIYLRVKLMYLLYDMVDLDGHYFAPALESVFAVFSSLNMDYEFIDLFIITMILEKFAKHKSLMKFDEKLADALLELKTLRLSAIEQNVSYEYSKNPSRYQQPVAFHGLYSLISTIAGFAQLEVLYDDEDMGDMKYHTTNILRLITVNFGKTCQTPHLFDVTNSCIISVKRIEIAANALAST